MTTPVTADLRAYMRRKNAERRAVCRQIGACRDCLAPAGTFTRCKSCRDWIAAKRRALLAEVGK